MNIDKAIKILELHNKWRRDNEGKYKMAEPKELGKAIDTVVSEFENLHLQNVVGRSEQLRTFLLFIQEQAPNYRTKQLKPKQVIKAYLGSL